MKTKLFVVILSVLVVSFGLAVNFPLGSVMNFNPAYMVNGTKWSFSYETYFEGQKMDFVVFQPFENGFAGKLGVYSDGNSNGLAYSIASKVNTLALGGDFLLSTDGTSVSLDVGFGMTQQILKNLIFDLRVPQTFLYTYNQGIEVHPNAKLSFDWEEKNWNVALFGGVDYPWVNGGVWGSFSFFGLQSYGYFEMGYNSTLAQVIEQRVDFILQYTLANIKLAYIYDSHSTSTLSTEENHGIRISVQW